MYRLLFILFSLSIVCTSKVRAQYQSPPVWSFGNNAGLDFRSGGPIPFKTSIYTHAAVPSTQCDAAGNILFYANGLKIWDANGVIMPGSANPLWPNNYTSGWNLNAMIIPDAADTNKFYVFTVFPSKGNLPWGDYFVGQLTYSVVDMTLNNGMGDVVQGQSHNILDTNCGHYMTIIPGEPCKYWVVVQAGNGRKRDYSFKCYEVNPSGVNKTPVTSNFTTVPGLSPNGNGQGVGIRAGNMIYSHTRSKIIASYESADVTAYDFNTSTGVVSNPVALTWAYPMSEHISSASIPAICLSPDELILYVSGYATSVPNAGYMLQQFPLIQNGSVLSVGNPVTIFNPMNSQFLAVKNGSGSVWQKSAMQLGPDNKIYHAFTMGQDFVGRINSPNVVGQGCNFIPDEIKLMPNTYTTSSMPAPMFVRKPIEKIEGSTTDSTICFSPTVTLKAPIGYDSYLWQNGSVLPELVIDASGVFNVKSTRNDCKERIDTFTINMVDFSVDLGRDITTCYDAMLQANTNVNGSALYTWSDGSTESSLNVNASGTYWLSIVQDGCENSDTISVVPEVLSIDMPKDTTICTGEQVPLDATIKGASYLWHDGSTESIFTAGGRGLYSVTVTKGYCTINAMTNIEEEYCDRCFLGMPNAFTPNGDGLNDEFKPIIYPICPIREFKFAVYNRFGERVFMSSETKIAWDGNYKGRPADLGAYYYYLKFKGPQNKDYFHKGDVLLLR